MGTPLSHHQSCFQRGFGLSLGSSFASEPSVPCASPSFPLSPLPSPFLCVTHWGIRVIAFVLKQASTHVCRLFKTMECKRTHAMFLRCQQEKGPWFSGFWWKGDPRCFKKLSGHADLISTPASKHSVCFWKIGIKIYQLTWMVRETEVNK